jgi:hypothetical protein
MFFMHKDITFVSGSLSKYLMKLLNGMFEEMPVEIMLEKPCLEPEEMSIMFEIRDLELEITEIFPSGGIEQLKLALRPFLVLIDPIESGPINDIFDFDARAFILSSVFFEVEADEDISMMPFIFLDAHSLIVSGTDLKGMSRTARLISSLMFFNEEKQSRPMMFFMFGFTGKIFPEKDLQNSLANVPPRIRFVMIPKDLFENSFEELTIAMDSGSCRQLMFSFILKPLLLL